MRIKRLSSALVISIVCHIVVVIIAGFHLEAQDRQFKELRGTKSILFSEAPKPKVRKPILKSGIKPDAHRQNQFLSPPQVKQKLTAANKGVAVEVLNVPTSLDQSNTRVSAPENASVADLLNAHVSAPGIPTTAESVVFKRPPGLVTRPNVGAARDTLGTTDKSIILGNVIVPQRHPPKGEASQAIVVEGEYLSPTRVLQHQTLNPPNGAAYDDVFFKDSGTNPFIDTEDDAFSTFGMDVDTASYAVMRRYLRDGYLPPSEAIRVEEFVNALGYNYAPPTDAAFAIHLEGAPSKFGEGT